MRVCADLKRRWVSVAVKPSASSSAIPGRIRRPRMLATSRGMRLRYLPRSSGAQPASAALAALASCPSTMRLTSSTSARLRPSSQSACSSLYRPAGRGIALASGASTAKVAYPAQACKPAPHSVGAVTAVTSHAGAVSMMSCLPQETPASRH